MARHVMRKERITRYVILSAAKDLRARCAIRLGDRDPSLRSGWHWRRAGWQGLVDAYQFGWL